MGRSTRAGSLLTREKLVRAGRELFLEHGYDGVGMEDVAAAADVTRGALYHHFGSKRGLFAAVAATVHAEVADAVAAAARSAGPGWPGIEAGCVAFLEAASSARVRRILLLDAPAVLGWQHWRSVDAANSRRLLEEGLGELERAGELRGGDAQAVAMLLSGAMNEAVLWLAEEPGRDAGRRMREALTMMLRALRPGAAPS